MRIRWGKLSANTMGVDVAHLPAGALRLAAAARARGGPTATPASRDVMAKSTTRFLKNNVISWEFAAGVDFGHRADFFSRC
jgi:hypothetical protein